MSNSRYKIASGGVYNVCYYFVWCPKYRRPVLTEEVKDTLKELIMQKAKQIGVTVEALEVMPDHVHLFVSCPPTLKIPYIVNQFKGFTSHVLRERFPRLRSRLPTLWSRSYYVGTIGHVSESVVRAYIENQKGK